MRTHNVLNIQKQEEEDEEVNTNIKKDPAAMDRGHHYGRRLKSRFLTVVIVGTEVGNEQPFNDRHILRVPGAFVRVTVGEKENEARNRAEQEWSKIIRSSPAAQSRMEGEWINLRLVSIFVSKASTHGSTPEYRKVIHTS